MRAKFYVHKYLFVLALLITQFLNGQNCVEFSNLPNGNFAANDGFPFGTPFHSESGASLDLAPFQYSDGSVRNNVSVDAGTFFWSGTFSIGQVIRLVEASTEIDFTQNFAVADNVSFDFLDWKGNINLSINGEPVRNARSFAELPNQIATYVTMTVDDSSVGVDGRLGTVSFSGPIYSLIIGGTELGLDNICFTEGVEPACTITHVTPTQLPCSENGSFNLSVDYNGINTGDMVNILVNNTSFGPFSANQAPYTVGPFTGDGTTLVVEVSDAGNSGCSKSQAIVPEICENNTPCEISNLTARAVDCAGDYLFDALIDFDRNSSPSEQFEVTVNGVSYGTFHYTLFPVKLTLSGAGPFVNNVLVCDASDSNCCINTSFNGFECPPACNMSALTTEIQECDNGMFNVLVGLQGSGFSNEMYVTLNDEEYGEVVFPTSSFPITVGPLTGDGVTSYRVDIFDVGDFSCANEVTIAPILCEITPPCNISDLTVSTTQCNGINEYGAVINFNITSSPSEQFIVKIDGTTIGSYPANSFPLTLNNLPSNGLQNSILTVSDASDLTCSLETSFQRLDCRPACSIDELTVTPMACNPNDQFMIQVNLSGTTLDNPINVLVNGQMVEQYNPSDFPIMVGPYLGDGNTVYNISVADSQLPNCSNSRSITAPQCEPIPVCDFTNLTVANNGCSGDNLQSITLNFDYTEVNSGVFVLRIGNNVHGQYGYNSLPLTLTDIPTAGNGTTTIEVSDSESLDCTLAGNFATLNCAVAPDCVISGLEVEVVECTGEDTYSLSVDFTHANAGTDFTITLGSTMIGPINYNNLPLTINNVVNTANLQQSITVCDNENPDCCQTLSYMETDCSVSLCNISQVTSERMDCSEGMFMVKLDAEFINPGNAGFKVFGNTIDYGNFAYTDLPITLGPFEGDGNKIYEFVLTDLEDSNCSNFTTVDAYDCTNECQMGDLQFEVGDCQSDGMVPVTFSFSSDNNSGSYTISQNNTTIMTMEYASGPVTIMLDGTSLAPYNMTFKDLEVETCTSSIPVGPFGCITTANRETELSNVKVFVNEATERLNIEMPATNKPTIVNIYTLNGQRVIQNNFGPSANNFQLDISNLNSNIYVVEIIQNQKRAVRKIHRVR